MEEAAALSNPAPDAKPSALSTFIQVFIAPRKAFATIKERPMIWLPLLLLMVGPGVLSYWYMHALDINWMQQKLLVSSNLSSMNIQVIPEMNSQGAIMKNITLPLIALPIDIAVFALYLWIVSKIATPHINYKQWFAFSIWTSTPHLLAILFSFIQIFLSNNGQITGEEFPPSYLNSSSHWSIVFNSIGLIFIWILVLQINGFQQWTNKSKLQSMGIILVPQILWFSLILFITYLVR